jgi:hypothetical protein
LTTFRRATPIAAQVADLYPTVASESGRAARVFSVNSMISRIAFRASFCALNLALMASCA